MVFRQVEQPLIRTQQLAPAVTYMGNGHGVALNACHHHRRTHLAMVQRVRFLVKCPHDMGTCIIHLCLTVRLVRMFLPVIHYGIRNRLACHFSHSVTAHTIADHSQPTFPVLAVHYTESVFIIPTPSRFTDCRVMYLHISQIYDIVVTANLPFQSTAHHDKYRPANMPSDEVLQSVCCSFHTVPPDSVCSTSYQSPPGYCQKPD